VSYKVNRTQSTELGVGGRGWGWNSGAIKKGGKQLQGKQEQDTSTVYVEFGILA
jgi:hypothetical protein